MTCNNKMKGILWMNVAASSFALHNAMARYLSENLTVLCVTFVILAGQFLIMIPPAIISRYKFRWSVHKWVFVRAALSVAATFMLVYGINHLDLPKVSSLTLTSPIITTIFSSLFLKDKMNVHIFIALLFGLAGAAIIVEPWNAYEFSYASLIVLLAVICWGLEDIAMKVGASQEKVGSQIFYLSLFRVLMITPFILYFNYEGEIIANIMMPHTIKYGFLASLAGLIGIAGCILAFRRTSLNTLTPFFFTGIIYSSILAYIFFGELIKDTTIIGVTLIFIGSVYTVYSNRR